MHASAADSVRDALRVRRAEAADVDACARICYDAFTTLNRHHNFPPDFPDVETVRPVLGMMFAHPRFYCVVAELRGAIIGSNCLDERASIAGVGPITIDPAAQNQSAGRMLMQAVMQRAEENGAPGVRLVQAAFHSRSLSLYAKLGFIVREPLAVMQGPPLNLAVPGYTVRHATTDDLKACRGLCWRVHGIDRDAELRDMIAMGLASVAEFDGRITAYASATGFFGYAVAASNRDLEALLGGAGAFLGSGILVPTRNAALFRWCLEHGLRVVEPMNLMSVGLYNEPAGAWLPSISF
jgi:GNAT superfamily N-acetyltransferase